MVMRLTAYRLCGILAACGGCHVPPDIRSAASGTDAVAVSEDRYMDLLGDVMALVGALEEHGHHIEG